MSSPSSLARLPQIRERFKRAMNMKVVTDKNGHGFQFRLPGFAYDDFDRSGRPSPAKLIRMMETFRFIDTKGGFAAETSSMSFLFYLLGQHVVISDLGYTRAALNCPVLVDCRVSRVGATSLDLCHTMSLVDKANLTSDAYVTPAKSSRLLTRLLRIVYFDLKLQKPTVIPDAIRAPLVGGFDDDDDAQFPDVKMPKDFKPGCFSYSFQPRFDDMDCYFHVNQGLYVEYAAECAARASVAGAYPHFEGDTCFRSVKSAFTLYAEESFPSDQLTIYTWEDPDDTCSLFFVLKKKEKLVFRAKFVYYPDEQKHKL